MELFSYSVAIRTLAKNPDVLETELKSIERQTIRPEKVLVYIADGSARPSFVVGKEEYVWVKKGMVAQRALEYREIDSDVILMLDDDVELAEDSAEKLLNAMAQYGADCVAADTFKNQEMNRKQKLMAWVTSWVYAHKDDGWAFKQCRNGAFSYNRKPHGRFCLTETFAGPCWMVKKNVLRTVRLENELWMDRMGFAYGDDAVESYKIFLNGFISGVLYDSGVKNLDAKTSSSVYHKSGKKFYTRSFGMFATWWRMIYKSRDKRWLSVLAFGTKSVWLLCVHLVIAIVTLKLKVPIDYVCGMWDGWRFVHTKEFKAIPPYIIKKES